MRGISRYTFVMTTFARTLLLGVFLGLVTGCTPWATYPPIEGAAGLNEPGMPPIPTLMAMAVTDRFEATGQTGAVVYNLPPGITESVYRRFEHRMDRPAQPAMEVGEDAIHVISVRVRANDAEVDVIDVADGVPQMTTVHLGRDLLGGWKVQRRRVWRIHVSVPKPQYPRATPQPATQPASQPANQPATQPASPPADHPADHPTSQPAEPDGGPDA